MARYFTVEEANDALQVIRPLVRRLLDIRQAILARQPSVWPVLEKAVGNGGSRAASDMQADFAQLEMVVKEIQATGAAIKDVNSGLIDFPALRDGREILLCWQFDEPEILYWHDLDAGFAGRQRL